MQEPERRALRTPSPYSSAWSLKIYPALTEASSTKAASHPASGDGILKTRAEDRATLYLGVGFEGMIAPRVVRTRCRHEFRDGPAVLGDQYGFSSCRPFNELREFGFRLIAANRTHKGLL